MNPSNYKETGNKVPVTMDMLISKCHALIAEYERTVSQQSNRPPFNPYMDPIIITTDDGKTIMVPKEVQKQAIDLWHNQTGQNVPLMRQYVEYEHHPVMKHKKKSGKSKKENNNNNTNYIMAIIILVALWLFFVNK